MTTDKGLVESLEAWAPLVSSGYEVPAAGTVMQQAAARIRELEAKVEKLNDAGMKMLCEISKQARDLGRLEAFRDAAEARRRKLEGALRGAVRTIGGLMKAAGWADGDVATATCDARALLDQADGEEGNG